MIPPSPELEKRAQDVKETYDEVLINLPGVVAVGSSMGGLVIGTRDEASAQFLDDLIEDEIQGVPVTFEVLGDVVAQGYLIAQPG